VFVFEKPSVAYEIEFCDDSGNTLATIALKPEQLRI
jgi:hypothetical protein